MSNYILKNTMWSFIGTFGTQGITFIINIILARILMPEQFGIICIIMVFADFGTMVIDFGFSQGIIQYPDVTDDDLSSYFFFNLFVGLVITIIFFMSSDLIESFYNINNLATFIKVVSFSILITSLSLVQRTILFRNIQLKKEAIVIIITNVLSGVIGIYLALKGYGIWALVAKILSRRSFDAILLWILSDWKPRLIFHFGFIKKIIKFSSFMFGNSLLSFFSNSVDKLIIGKIGSASFLGNYDRGKALNNLTKINIGRSIGKIVFPTLSKIQQDHKKYEEIYKLYFKYFCFTFIPLFFLLSLVSKPLIILLLTEKWIKSAAILKIFALAGFLYPIHKMTIGAINAKGKSNISFYFNILKIIIVMLSILCGSLFSIMSIVVFLTIGEYVSFFILLHIFTKINKFSFKDYILIFIKPFFLSALIYCLIQVFVINIKISPLINILLISFLMIGIYLLGANFFIDDLNKKIFSKIRGIIKINKIT